MNIGDKVIIDHPLRRGEVATLIRRNTIYGGNTWDIKFDVDGQIAPYGECFLTKMIDPNAPKIYIGIK